MLRSLRWQLTGWYVLLLAGVLLLFSAGSYVAVRKLLLSSFDDVLTEQAQVLVQTMSVSDGKLDLQDDVLLSSRRDTEHFMRLYHSDGRLAADTASDQAPELPDAVTEALHGQRQLTQIPVGKSTMRIGTFPITRNGQVVGALQVGVSLEDVEDTLHTLLKVLLVSAPLTLMLTSGGGLFLADRALRPIDQITRTAQRISAEQLSSRIDFHGPDDEIGRLAHTFNNMLARLETAFLRQRQFTADASHELRTPLTAIIGQLEVMMTRPRHPESDSATLAAIHKQAQRLARLVGDLLFLARTDAQLLAAPVEPLDLGVLLPAIAAQMEPLAAAREQTIAIEAAALIVLGDEDQLIRLVMNLLDNAIRYTPPGGRITLTCAHSSGAIAISVGDTGPGIAPEHLPRLFDRFFRLDRGRSRSQGGSGLGLAIVQSIAQAHGGRIAVESAVGQGSTFTLFLPEHAIPLPGREPRRHILHV